jgi:hypothetical protein
MFPTVKATVCVLADGYFAAPFDEGASFTSGVAELLRDIFASAGLLFCD